MQEYENKSQQMSSKLMQFVSDYSHDEEEYKTEVEYLTELIGELMQSDRYNVLMHHLDTMFMDDIFNKEN
jgi:hypothetical protein